MRLIYLGTPAIAVAPLRALVAAGHEVAAVITQPDRPAGRGGKLRQPPVKEAALELGLPVLQPETLKDQAAVAQLRALEPEAGVVAAYGEILRRDVLAIPPLGYLNIHPSLLPLYRGPSPVTAAILAGDEITGVSVMLLERAMDAGPLLAQATVPLDRQARAGALTEELFELGARLLVDVLPRYASGEVVPHPQNHSAATVCHMLSKDDGQIDWALPALVIERMTRAFDPWPGTSTSLRGQQLKLISASVDDRWGGSEQPGTILDRPGLVVATGSGTLEVLELQPAGKRPMRAEEFRRGQRDLTGAVLEKPSP